MQDGAYDKIDEEQNQLTLPPNDEEIRTPTIWVLEAYTPTQLGKLFDALERIGWNKEQSSFFGNSNIRDWIEAARLGSYGGAWANLGYVVRRSDFAFGPYRKADLPDAVDSIRVALWQPLPSMSIFIWQFILKEEVVRSLEEPLRAKYSTYSTPTKNGYVIHTVDEQKTSATDSMRAYLRSICTEWVKQNLPGFFSRESAFTQLPTCELLLLKKHRPFEKINERNRLSFLNTLRLQYKNYSWQSNDAKGLFLQFHDSSDTEYNHAVLVGNIEDALVDKDLKMFGNESREKRIIHWLEYFDWTLGTWVLDLLTTEFEEQLNRLRDEYAEPDLKDVNKASLRIRELDKQFLDIERDLIPFLDQLKAHCSSEPRFMHEVYNFEAVQPIPGQLALFHGVRVNLLRRITYLELAEKQLRAVANRTSYVLSAISSDILSTTNLKLQRRIQWMTLALLILTIVLALPVIQNIEILKAVWNGFLSTIAKASGQSL